MRCDQCKYWQTDNQKRAGKLVVSRCAKALMWWDTTEWTVEDDTTDVDWDNQRRLLPESEGNKMFVQDGSDYSASLFTAPDFHCAHFEQP